MGNLAQTGRDTAGAVGRGDVKGVGSGVAKVREITESCNGSKVLMS